MKKTTIIILAVLPIVLLVIISFAGRFLSQYQHIAVERVEFLTEESKAATDNDFFILEQGTTKATAIRIFPDFASNKKVSYLSEDESICTIDENGIIHGITNGTTRVSVTTDDGNKTAYLNVKVTADIPTRVVLSQTELSMKIGENAFLSVEVYELVALNKNVTFTSSDPSTVTVNASGKLTALKEGTATITATAVSGGASASCTVTVVPGDADIRLDFSNDPTLTLSGALYITESGIVNIGEALRLADEIDPDSVVIKIISGQKNATLENGILTIQKQSSIIKVQIFDSASPDKPLEASFLFTPPQIF